MGLFSFLDRFRASSDRSEWGDFWFEPVTVRSSSGVRVSADNALRLAAVYASVRILAETMASLPFVLYRLRSDGGKDRLVLTSGGVARDFLSIFRRSIDVVVERVASKDTVRGPKIGVEDVNVAAGDQGQFKEEDFSRDTSEDDQARLRAALQDISDFV